MKTLILLLGLLVIAQIFFAGELMAASDSTSSSTFTITVANPTVDWVSGKELTDEIDLSSALGLNNAYVNSGQFTVSSSTSYGIEVELIPLTGGGPESWDIAYNPVKMNLGNMSVIADDDYRNAFDIAVTDRQGNWSDWIRGDINQKLTGDQNSNTLGEPDNTYTHDIEVALVLVDSPVISQSSNPNSTSGYSSLATPENLRRFKELPARRYNTDIRVTVIEDLQ